jgi:outer membrane protein assembly factor BamB
VYSDPIEQHQTVQIWTLIAIQGQTGKTLWQRAMPGGDTALADGGDTVYTVSRLSGSSDSRLLALSAATGAVRWQETIPNAPPYSPVLAQGVLYLTVMLSGPAPGYQILALRASDGSQLWTAPIESVPPGMGPTLSVTADMLFVQFSSMGFEVRRITDGRVLWSESQVGRYAILGPDAVYVFPGYGSLVARDAQTGTQLWQFGDHLLFHTSVVSGDTLFVTAQHGGPTEDAQGKIINPETLYALDAASGRLRWTFATQSRNSGSLAAGRDTVYIKADDGIHALRSSDGAVRWRSDSYHNWTFDGFSARPAVVDPVLYVTALEMLPLETFTVFGSSKAQTYLYAVNEADGSVNWSIAVGPVITIHPHFLS